MEHRVIFSGEVAPGFEPEAVKRQLARRMKLTPEQIEKLFSGRRIILKKGLDAASAAAYTKTLGKLGAVAAVEPPPPGRTPAEPAGPSALQPPRPAAKPRQNAKTKEQNPYQAPASSRHTLFCRSCGVAVKPRQPKCHACGADQEVGKARSKYVAAALALFLGWVGAHRLYLGQWWGVLYFLFYIVMWPVAVIEAIVFLLTPGTRWDDKYGNVKPLGAVVYVVIIIVGIAIMGILAAIAIPAYHDYMVRAKVAQAIVESETYREQLESHIQQTGTTPSSNAEAGLPESIQTSHVAALTIGPNGVMTLGFQGDASLEGHTMAWTPSINAVGVAWRCDGGSLANRHRPPKCRTEKGMTEAESTNRGLQVARSADGRQSLTLTGGGWKSMAAEGTEIAYVHEKRDVGIAVVREPKQDFEPHTTAEDYADMLMEYAFEEYKDRQFSQPEPHPLGSMPARLFTFDGYTQGLAIKGWVAAVEGRDDFYKVMTWTTRRNFDRQRDFLLSAMESFEEQP